MKDVARIWPIAICNRRLNDIVLQYDLLVVL